MEKILRALLSKAYKLDAGQIDEILKDENEAEKLILEADATRVATLTKPKEGQTFADGHKKGTKEALEKLEKSVKEKFGVEADVTGLELIEKVIEEKTAGAGGAKPKDLTDDDVRKHPAYINREKELNRALKDQETDYKTQLSQKDTEFTRKETIGKAQAKAMEVLEGLKPVYSKNPTIAQNIKNTFLQSLTGYDFDITDSGITIMKDGKVVTDSHGNNLSFDELVKTNAGSYFEFQNNNGGANGGNDNNDHQQGGGADYPAGISKPKNLDELGKILGDESIKLEDRLKVSEVWEKETSAV